MIDAGTMRRRGRGGICALALAAAFSIPAAHLASGAVGAELVEIPAGSMTPFFPQKNRPSVKIAAFLLDRDPVTNQEFLNFLQTHPEWRKSSAKPVFVDAHYLEHWNGDLAWPDNQSGEQPVTNVSWFAASAYCEAEDKRLPTTDQWEYALADGGRNEAANRDAILAWYSQPNRSSLPTVSSLPANGYGVRGLIGGVWEWSEDFNSAMSGPELRESGTNNRQLFCGGASLGAKDPSAYEAFMRFSMRVSLKATYSTDNLGFRCAREAKP